MSTQDLTTVDRVLAALSGIAIVALAIVAMHTLLVLWREREDRAEALAVIAALVFFLAVMAGGCLLLWIGIDA